MVARKPRYSKQMERRVLFFGKIATGFFLMLPVDATVSKEWIQTVIHTGHAIGCMNIKVAICGGHTI